MRAYCFKTCISISHSNDYNPVNAHIHTVEIAVYVKYKETYSDIKKFEDAERLIDACLEPYRECYLNDMEGFGDDVSLEYLGERLFWQLDDKLDANNMLVEKCEISETPLRAYIVTRTI